MNEPTPSVSSQPAAMTNLPRRRAIALAIGAAFAMPQLAYALPTGGTVVSGSSAINQTNASTLAITQSTTRSAINWLGFNTSAGESVVITQPAGGVALYRVGNPVEFYGRLSATGQIFLSSPTGVHFAPGASVDVGGLVATTLSMSQSDFDAGRNIFTNTGATGSVLNRGSITATNGYVALLGPQVANEGVIAARMGSVALAAGDKITLDMVGDGLIKVTVDQAALNAAAMNKGTIEADGGNVFLTARSANALLDTVINTEGVIRANSIGNRNGTITLDGGDRGIVSVAGQLEAKGNDAGTTGGTVKALGQYVGLFNGANINASGGAGGGMVLVGGNFQGKGPERNAFRTFVGSGATINADAVNGGNGGKVIVWADDVTRYYGSISAKGGAQSGDGGFVEVSGKKNLVFAGAVDTAAAHGKTGTLLLDPDSINIQVDTTGANDAEAADGTINFADALNSNITISETALEGLGAGTNIFLQADVDITVNGALTGGLTLAQTGTVTFEAGNNIAINSPITAASGAVITLSANNNGSGQASGVGTVTIAAAGSLNSGGDNIVLTNNGSSTALALGGSINAGAGQVTLTSTAAGITQSGGTITAATLTGSSGGIVGLGQTNAITNLGAFTSAGGFTLVDAGGLNVTGTVSNSGAGTVNVTTTGGTLAVSNPVTSSGNGAITLNATGATGDITVAAASVSSTGGNITLNADRSITVANTGISTSGTGNVVLRADNSGTITGTVGLTGAAAVTLGTGTATIFYDAAGALISYAGNVTGGTATNSTAWVHLAGSRVYDGTTDFAGSAFGTAGTITTTAAETLNVTGTGTVPLKGVAAGAQALTTGSLVLGDGTGTASNYAIAGAGNTGTVTARALTVSGATVTATKTYDGNANALSPVVNFSNKVGAEVVDATVTTSLYDNGKNVQTAGPTTVSYSTVLTGGDAGNYTLVAGSTAGNAADITARALTVSGATVTATKTYDGNANALSPVVNFSNKVGAEVVDATVTTSLYDNGKNVQTAGPTTVSYSTVLTGGDAGNYTLVAGSTAGNAADITARALTVSGATVTATKTYDGNANALSPVVNFSNKVGAEVVDATVTTSLYDNGKNVQTAGPTTVSYSTVLTGGDAGNYTLVAGSTAGNAADITARALTVSGATVTATKTYDGNANALSPVVNFSNKVGAEVVDATVTTSLYDNGKNVQTAGPTTVSYSTVLTGGDAGNYTLVAGSTAGNAADITARALTVSGATVTATKTYDGNANALSPVVNFSNKVGAEVVDATVTTSLYDNGKNVQTAGPTTVSYSTVLTGGDAGNYTLVAGSTAGNAADITARALTVSGATVTATKTYDGNANALSPVVNFSNKVGAEVVDATVTTSLYDNGKNVQTAGPTTVSYSTVLTGGDAGNYTLVAGSTAGNAADITARALTVSGATVTATKTYDGNANALSPVVNFSNKVGAEVVDATVTTSLYDNGKNVQTAGPTTVSYSTVLTGGDAGNYTLVAGSTAGNAADITARALTVSGATVTATKTYDGNANALSPVVNFSNKVGAEVVDATVTTSLYDNGKNVQTAGPTTVSYSTVLTGGDAGNYTLVAGSTAGNAADITARALTVSGATVTATKTYDGNANALSPVVNFSNKVGAEVVDATVTTSLYDNGKNVQTAGPTTVSYSTVLTGGDAGNYTLVAGSTAGNAADITARALTVSGATVTATKTYDGNANALSPVVNFSNKVGAEVVDATVTTSLYDNGKNVQTAGPTTVSYSTVLTGGDAGNYTLVAGSTAGNAADITARALTVSGATVTATKTYDGNANALSPVVNFSNKVGAEVVDATVTTSLYDNGKNVQTAGPTTVSYSTVLTGGDAGNYTLVAGSTAGNAADITARALTVSGATVTATKTYDGNANALSPVVNFSNKVGAEVVDATVTTSLYDNGKNVQTAGPTTVSYSTVLTGGDAGNYTLVAGSTAGNAADITARALTVSGATVTATKTYDGNANALSPVVNFSNKVGAEVVDATVTTSLYDNGKNVQTAGPTTVSYSTVLTGGDAGNYTLVAGSTAGNAADITARALTVSGATVTATKTYDGNANALSPVVNFSNKVGAEVVDATVTTSLYDNGKNVQTAGPTTVSYSTVLTGGDAGNYTLVAGSTAGNAADITARALTVSGATVTATKTYDGNANALSPVVNFSNKVGAEVVDATVTTSLYDNGKNVQTAGPTTVSYSTVLTGGDAGNYTLVAGSTAGNAADITARALTVSGATVTATKTYDGNANALSPVVNFSNAVGGDAVVAGITTSVYDAGKNVQTGGATTVTYQGTAGLTGGDAGNYTLVAGSTAGNTADITRLGSVMWTGAVNNNWSNAGNWTLNAIPDFSNVLAVNLNGGNVTFDGGTATLASAVVIGSIGGAGNLTVTGAGTLTVNTANAGLGTLNVGAYAQTGVGSTVNATTFTATSSFNQTAGQLNVGAGGAGITHSGSALVLGNITTSSSGNLVINSSNPISQTAGTALVIDGNLNAQAGANAITLTQPNNDFKSLAILGNSGANAIQITDTNAIQLGTVNTANNLTVSAVGITQDASGLTVGGTSTFNGGAGVITLTTAGNSFTGAVSANNTGANAIQLTAANAIDLGTVSTANDLTVSAGGAITQSGTVAVTGLSSFSGTSVTLGGSTFNTGTLTFNSGGAVTISEASAMDLAGTNTAGSAMLTSTAGISDAGATSTTVTGLLSSNGTSIDLTKSLNAGTLSFNSGGAVAISEASAMDLAGTNTAGSATLTSTAGISDAGATSTTVTGLLSSNGTSIDLTKGLNAGTQSFNSAGAVTISEASAMDLAGTNTAGSATLTSTAGISDAGATSTTVAGLLSSNGTSIDLTKGLNAGTQTFNSGGAVTISESSSMDLAGTNTAGSATLTSTAGISDAGATSTTVTGLLSSNGTSIDLTKGLNAGTQTFNSGGAVTISESSSMDLAGTNTAGSAMLTSTAGISDAGATSTAVAGLLSSNGTSISLTKGLNAGTQSFNSAGAVAISEASAMDLAGTNTAGSATLTSTAGISDASATSTTVTGLLSSNGTSISLTKGLNAGTQRFNSAGAVTISEASAMDLVSTNTAGSATLTSTAGISDAGATSTTVTGLLSSNGTSISLTKGLNAGTQSFNSAGAVTISEASPMDIVGVNTGGTTSLTSTAGISDAGATSVNVGALTVNGTSVSLGGGTFNAASVNFNSAGNVTVAEDSQMDIVGANAAGSAALSSTAALTDATATSVTVTGLGSFSGASVNLGGGTFNTGTLTFNSAGAVTIAEDSAMDIVGSNSAGSATLSTPGSLTTTGAITTGSGSTTLTAADAVTLGAALGGGTGAIAINANTGAGAGGFTQNAGGTITTGNASATAVTILVNTASGGTGTALLRDITTGNGGTITVSTTGSTVVGGGNTTGGSIFDAAGGGSLLNTGTGTINLLVPTTGASAVGTLVSPILTSAGSSTVVARAAAGGAFIRESDGARFDVIVGNNGTIVIISNSGQVSIAQLQTGGNASVTANGTGSKITQDNPIFIGGTSNFTAAQGAVLLPLANDFVGAFSAAGIGVTVNDINNLFASSINSGTGAMNLTAAQLVGPSSLTGSTGFLSSGGNVIGQNVLTNFSDSLTLGGAATLWNLQPGSVANPFLVTSDNINLAVGGGVITASVAAQTATFATSAAQSSATAAAADEASKTFGTDSVAEQVEYGFAGDVGTLPPMDHRLMGVGISVPKCFNNSREGESC